MTGPQVEVPYEPLTPIQVEEQLRKLHNESRAAQKEMRTARLALVDARGALTIAKAVLEFAVADATTSPECPVPGRSAGEVTVAFRDAWVVKQTKAERLAVLEAEANTRRLAAAMEAARDFARSVSEQLSAVQSIGAQVRDAYRGTGRP